MSHVNFLSIRSRDLIIKFWDGNHTTKSSILTHLVIRLSDLDLLGQIWPKNSATVKIRAK